MILRLFNFGRFAALLLCGLAFSAAPASADGCGSYGCYQPAPDVVQPVAQPCCYQPCSCCGCGSSYYSSYYPAYTYPQAYGYQAGYNYGYGGAGGYAGGYEGGYQGGYQGGVVAPRIYRPRVAFPRYFGPRRYLGPRRVYARFR